jgi:hypothetical protein
VLLLQVELRNRLEDNLHGKDDDIAQLSGQVQRLNHALKVGAGGKFEKQYYVATGYRCL